MTLYPKNKNSTSWWVWLALAGITVLALAFRTFKLALLPGGLFPDEAANGLDINLMEQGVIEPFYERGNGREALFFYLLWTSVKIFGRSPFAHHLVSAIIGTLSVLACYLVAKQLIRHFKQSNLQTYKLTNFLPLFAAFIMATSSWHVVLSRTAFRANMIPLLSALTLWAMLSLLPSPSRAGGRSAAISMEADKERARVRLNNDELAPPSPSLSSQAWTSPPEGEKKMVLRAMLFGAFFALGFYTYIAFRIMVPFVAVLVLWPGLAFIKQHGLRALISKFYKPAIAAATGFVVFFAPLGHYFYTHPGSFVGRSGQVSVFNPELNKGDLAGTILTVTRDSLLAYFTVGDINWRHNISGAPFLPLIISPFFAVGLILCIFFAIRYALSPIRQSHRFPEFLLIGWFCSMLLPVITTAEGIPHGLRAIGTIPAVFIMTAYGMWKVYAWLSAKLQANPITEDKLITGRLVLKAASTIYIVFLLFALPYQTYQLYFVHAARNPEYQYAFRADLTAVSEYLKQYGNRETTYLIVDKFSIQTVDYLTTIYGRTSCDRNDHYRPSTCVDNPKNKPFTQVDPEESWRPGFGTQDRPVDRSVLWPWTYGLKAGDEVVFTQSTIFDIKRFKEDHSNVELKLDHKNEFGETIMAVYVVK